MENANAVCGVIMAAVRNGMDGVVITMRIECEICGSYADLEKPPLNNICPVCFSVGSLFICEVIGEGHRESKVWTREDFERCD